MRYKARLVKKITCDKNKKNPNIFLCEDGIYKYTKDKDGNEVLIKVAESIKINSINENIDTKQIEYELKFIYKNELKTLKVNREILTKSKLLELQKYGLDVTENNAADVIRHLQNQELIAPKVKVYQNIGWTKVKGKNVFKHHKIIGVDNINASYSGELLIKPFGNFEEWEKLIKEEVIGNTALETMLCIGFSSALVGLLDKKIDNESLFVHINGDSTTGKTTSLMLALSIWGCPDPQKNGIFFSWNATTNSIFHILRNNTGILIGLDESSVSNREDFSSIIYQLANGKEKTRLNKDLQLSEVGNWKTTVISTGENSLLENSNRNKGLNVRLIEISDVVWTKDATNAEKIKKVVLSNYGHAGEKFVEGILSLDVQEIEKMFDEVMFKINDIAKTKRLIYRVLKKIVLIILTGKLINMFFDFEINIEKITNFLIKNITACNEEDSEELEVTALEFFKEYITQNIKSFYKAYEPDCDIDVRTFEVIGRIEEGHGRINEVYIPKNKMKEILKSGGFTNPETIIDKWNKKGILKTDKGRKTVKKKLVPNAPSAIRCICVKIEDEMSFKAMYEVKKAIENNEKITSSGDEVVEI